MSGRGSASPQPPPRRCGLAFPHLKKERARCSLIDPNVFFFFFLPQSNIYIITYSRSTTDLRGGRAGCSRKGAGPGDRRGWHPPSAEPAPHKTLQGFGVVERRPRLEKVKVSS